MNELTVQTELSTSKKNTSHIRANDGSAATQKEAAKDVELVGGYASVPQDAVDGTSKVTAIGKESLTPTNARPREDSLRGQGSIGNAATMTKDPKNKAMMTR